MTARLSLALVTGCLALSAHLPTLGKGILVVAPAPRTLIVVLAGMLLGLAGPP